MTQQQRDRINRITWPLVALAALVGAFFLILFALIPHDMPEARTALVGCLIASCTTLLSVVVQRLANKVAEVKDQVNGRMSSLIEAKTLRDKEETDSGDH